MNTNAKRPVDISSAPWTMHEFFAGSGLVAYGLKGMFAPVWANDISAQKANVNIVSNQNYAAQLNAVMEALAYPIPQKAQEEEAPKKARPRAPQERSSPERGTGSNLSLTVETDTDRKPSVKKRLEGLRIASEQTRAQEQVKGPKTKSR